MRNDFVDWDDLPLLVNNSDYQGLSLAHFRWMFTTTIGGHYQPLTWLSYAVDFKIWNGLNAAGVHFTNVFLHTVGCIGVFLLARRMRFVRMSTEVGAVAISEEASIVGPLFAGLFFGIHPLRVESVAWATERRDVLSGALLIFATLLYLMAMDSPQGNRRRLRFGCATLFYLGSLLSKAAGMTWPVILLLLDSYLARPRDSTSSASRWMIWGNRLLQKAPFLVLAVGSAAAGLWAQRSAGALWPLELHPLSLRVGQAFYGVLFYLGKSVWPIALLPLYEQPPTATATDMEYVVSAIGVLGITLAAFAVRRRIPSLWVGWLAYVVLLSPTLGLAQSGPQLVADRYSYLPSIVIAVVLGGGIERLWHVMARPRFFAARGMVPLGAVAMLAAFVVACRAQTAVWRDSQALWTHVLKHAPETGLAHVNLSGHMLRQQDHQTALIHGRKALEILPGNRTAHLNVADAAVALGYLDVAEHHLKSAIAIRADASTWASLAYVQACQGREDRAHAAFQEALHLDPHLPDAPFRLGTIREQLGDIRGAIREWNQGLLDEPKSLNLRIKLAWVLATSCDATIVDGPRALSLAAEAVADSSGQSLRAREALAAAYACTGDFERAVSATEDLLRETHERTDANFRARLERALVRYKGLRTYCNDLP